MARGIDQVRDGQPGILVVRLGAIGDVIHTLPAVASLRRHFPGARLAWVVESGGAAQVLRDHPLIDQLIELDLGGAFARRSEIRHSLASLSPFDIALDFQGLVKSSLLIRLAGIRRRIGFDYAALREPLAGLLLTERVAADDSAHIIEKNLQLVGRLGVEPVRPYQFSIEPSAEDADFARRVVEGAGARVAIINPGGGWPTKLWSPDRYAALADRLWKHGNIASIITHGPGEEALARAVIKGAREGAARALASSLKQLVALARRAVLFVGGDTGPMHLAAATGTPIVAIFGPTAGRRNGPFCRDDVIVARSDLECRVDCYRRRCEHRSCLDLSVDQVWEGVIERLRRAGIQSASP